MIRHVGCKAVQFDEAAGFWQAYGASNCPVKRNRMAVFLLSTATGLLLFLFPQDVAGLLADWFGPVSE